MRMLAAIVVVTAVTSSVFAQQSPSEQKSTEQKLVTTTFTVYGNCSMCKKRIEKPFKDMAGVTEASWDKTTKKFTITYDPAVLSERRIKETIAAQGYDTDEVKASDEVYNKLPKCCRYRDGKSHEE